MAKVSSVKLIGLEEHFVTNDVLAAWKVLEPRWQDVALELSDEGETGRRLADLGDERFAAMEETGARRAGPFADRARRAKPDARRCDCHFRPHRTIFLRRRSGRTRSATRGLRRSRRPIRTLRHESLNAR
jgi:hypothetical protein